MKKNFATIVFVLMLYVSAKAQDYEFTQFHSNPLYLNPAFSGSEGCSRIFLNYRSQWPKLTGNYKTFNTSYDQYINFLRGGIGGNFMYDNAGNGTISAMYLGGMYSYHLQIRDKTVIKAGIQAALVRKEIDWSKLNFAGQIDSNYGWVYTTQEVIKNDVVFYPDFSTGILFYNDWLFTGIAVHHITQPNESFDENNVSRLPVKFTFHGGTIIKLINDTSINFTLTPVVLYQQQLEFRQINFGINFKINPIIFGIMYRSKDALITMIGFQKGFLRFGYSYDETISRLGKPFDSTGGAHELSLGFRFNCKNKLDKIKTLKIAGL